MKNIYVITIFDKKFFVQSDGINTSVKKIGAENINNGLEDIAAFIINEELNNREKDIVKIRTTLKELQEIINLSSEFNLVSNIKGYFSKSLLNNKINERIENSSEIEQLKNMKQEFINNQTDLNLDYNQVDGVSMGGKQKVLSNGKSIVENDKKLGKDAFVSALVLAVIVEALGLFAFTLILLKI